MHAFLRLRLGDGGYGFVPGAPVGVAMHGGFRRLHQLIQSDHRPRLFLDFRTPEPSVATRLTIPIQIPLYAVLSKYAAVLRVVAASASVASLNTSSPDYKAKPWRRVGRFDEDSKL
jgi:hypothetical protein